MCLLYIKKKSLFDNNIIIFQGHAAPILYAAWAEAGLFPTSELMNLRKLDNDLEGHPTPVRDLFEDVYHFLFCMPLLSQTVTGR